VIGITAGVLVVLAAGYAVVNGLNDGGALIANGLKIQTLGVGPAIALLTGAVVVVPLTLGTRVADTLANRLVDLDGVAGQRALAVAILAAVGVVVVLARLGLPTSLTLATIGGITGSGIGAGRAIGWTMVGTVLVLAALAPLVGALLAWSLARVARRVTAPTSVARLVGGGHRAAFTLQCVAYGANDGQKMLAVAVLALGTSGASGAAPLGGLRLSAVLAVLGVLFLVGALLGVRRMAGTLSAGVLAVRPMNAVTAEVASGSAVLGTALVGAPVSMTQAMAGGLVGSGVSEGARRIRWRLVLNIGLAWVVTLPAALILAAVLAASLEVIT
jgi:inorganic phosphate transporter, PiT family